MLAHLMQASIFVTGQPSATVRAIVTYAPGSLKQSILFELLLVVTKYVTMSDHFSLATHWNRKTQSRLKQMGQYLCHVDRDLNLKIFPLVIVVFQGGRLPLSTIICYLLIWLFSSGNHVEHLQGAVHVPFVKYIKKPTLNKILLVLPRNRHLHLVSPVMLSHRKVCFLVDIANESSS